MSKFEYGGYYKDMDMTGEIHVGTGTVKVHDIFDPVPEFMRQADCIFCDPPCSLQNINTFYTKADRRDYQDSYEPFRERFFEVIDEIQPKKVFVEVFKSNKAYFEAELQKRYANVHIYQTTYYHKESCKCWILTADNDGYEYPWFEGMDEEDVIADICTKVDFDCIGDPCIGQGLVGFFADQVGRKFVGTELNEKRLAVLVERIKQGTLKPKKKRKGV